MSLDSHLVAPDELKSIHIFPPLGAPDEGDFSDRDTSPTGFDIRTNGKLLQCVSALYYCNLSVLKDREHHLRARIQRNSICSTQACIPRFIVEVDG